MELLITIADTPAPGWVTVTTGIVTTVGLIIVAIISNNNRKESKAINRAVNHSDDRGTVPLYDAILDMHHEMQVNREIRDTNTASLVGIHKRLATGGEKIDEVVAWKRSYADSPWSSGIGVQQWLAENEANQLEVLSRVKAIEEQCPRIGKEDTDA